MDFGYVVLKIVIAFIGIWVGSGIIIKSVDKLARKAHKSSFVISFLLLGFLTSVSEISVAVNSYIDQTLEVSVGNLLGGIIVLFLFLIPSLAIIGNGVKLGDRINKIRLIIALIVLLLPSIFMLDSHLMMRESLILIGAYLLCAIIVIRKKGSVLKVEQSTHKTSLKKYVKTFFFIIFGGTILFIACDLMVGEIMEVANIFNVSPFIVSLLGLAIGTNLPEISLAIKSILSNKKDIAFGNYLGSAVFNVLILGVLGVVNNRITIDANFLKVLIFSAAGLLLFYIFTRSKHDISRKEGFVLIGLYILFLITEMLFNGLLV